MLAALERELEGEPFVVVGVHSPKFPNERDPDMVRDAVRRYAISHPVVVDPGRRIWDEWGVSAWPTLVLVGSGGEIAAAGSGEPDREVLGQVVRELIAEGRRAGTLDGRPLPLRAEPRPAGSLAYPGKVIAAAERVFVADTGHDEVVECDAGGRELRRFAGFHHPNGLALAGDALYVADTGSHTVKRVDLASGEVTLVAGTGERGRGVPRGARRPTETALRSPWDLAWDSQAGRLYVAMAGSHQIWALEPAEELVWPFAGTGHETRVDGPAHEAAFAQPSGLALLGESLFVADSEISSIRAVDDRDASAKVRTVCGSGELFGFGDRDGVGAEVLLQHPLGIAAGDGVLYVADSYNHKVKRVDPATGECRTLYGNGRPERLPELFPGAALRTASPEEPAFFEPEGLAVHGGELLVADTNNHRIVAVDLTSGARRVFLGA